MGMTCTSCKPQFHPLESASVVSKKNFKLLFAIGKGGFGKVWKVIHKTTNIYYAMKEISKVKLYLKHSISLINQELLTLTCLRNFFISNLHFAFQTEEHLYLITDYFPGGDLRYHINTRHNKQFTHSEIAFILGCVLLAIVYLRKHSIVHRDIKPENLVFDSKGYLHLTDFGVSKCIYKGGVVDKSGTIGYAAPETILGLKHEYTADYFSLGVVAYELLTGFRPFRGKNKRQIKEQLLTKTVHLKPADVASSYNDICNEDSICDLVNSLLQRKPTKRLGANGIEEIVSHQFFKEFNWKELFTQEMESPFQIRSGEYSHCDRNGCWSCSYKRRDVYEGKEGCLEEYYWEILNRIKKEKVFDMFYYDYRYRGDKGCKGRREEIENEDDLDEFECFKESYVKWGKGVKRNSGVSALSTKCD